MTWNIYIKTIVFQVNTMITQTIPQRININYFFIEMIKSIAELSYSDRAIIDKIILSLS